MQQIVHQRLLEQMDRVRKIRTALGLLRVESKVLRRKLGAEGTPASLASFAESWRAIEERLEAERREAAAKTEPGAFAWVEKGLLEVREQVSEFRLLLARQAPGEAIAAALDALDQRNASLERSLETLGRQLAADLDEKFRVAYDRPS
jgi:hypothetical protein